MEAKAWYQQGWPWALILIPFSAVLFGILMITMATLAPDDLVVDDYYKDGMAINQRLALEDKARELGVVVHTYVEEDGGALTVRVDGANDSVIRMRLFHVRDKARDMTVLLYPEGDTYAPADPLPPVLAQTGIWYIEFEGADFAWRVRQRINTPVTHIEVASQ